MRYSCPHFFLALMVTAAVAYSKQPEINPRGIVNAASYQTNATGPMTLAFGSIATIFGKDLSTVTEAATAIPLPTSLAGTTVLVNGSPVPLLFVSPGQINFQVLPAEFVDYQSRPVVVKTQIGQSEPALIDFGSNVGIFTLDGSGCGRGLVLNVASDGSVSLNSPSNPAAPGDYITVFGTGSAWTDGSHSSVYEFDFMTTGGSSFLGRAPGMVGVDQVNIRIPETVREGCAVPLRILDVYWDSISQAIPISIRRSDGPCLDPPVPTYGQILWEKIVASGVSSSGQFEVVTAALTAEPGTLGSTNSKPGRVVVGATCPLPGYRGLDAGNMTAQGPGFGPLKAAPTLVEMETVSPNNGTLRIIPETVYRAVLPPGTIRAGMFNIAATGGGDVESFESAVRIGSDISLTTTFPPGTRVGALQTITATWTGGDPDTWVSMKLISHGGSTDRYYYATAGSGVRASEGKLTIIPGSSIKVPYFTGPAEIVIEVTPDPANIPTISAPGLSLGGQHTWKYTYRFGGLTIQ